MIIAGQLICAVVMGLILRPGVGALLIPVLRVRHGAFGTLMDIGHASGPIVTGLLIDLLGYRGAFGVVGVLLITITLLFTSVVRQPHQDQVTSR